MSYDENSLKKRMDGALTNLNQEFGGLRTGRASVNLLDSVVVPAYGAMSPLNQVGSVSAPEARMLSVNIWDKGMVAAADKAIRDAGLGLNPVVDGTPRLQGSMLKRRGFRFAMFAEMAWIL